MKVYVMTDLEGVAGAVSFESQTYATGKSYEESKKLLTASVNSVCNWEKGHSKPRAKSLEKLLEMRG